MVLPRRLDDTWNKWCLPLTQSIDLGGPSSPALPVGQRRCSRSGNPYGQPRWGFLGSGESASVRFRKSKKGRDFRSPPNKWKLMKSLEGGNFFNFQQIHTALFFVIFSVVFSPCLGAPAKHGRSSWRRVGIHTRSTSGARGALLSSVLCPPASERATKPPRESHWINGSMGNRLMEDGGKVAVFGK